MPGPQADSSKFLLVLFHTHAMKSEVRFFVYFNTIKGQYDEVYSFSACFHCSNTIIQLKKGYTTGDDTSQDQHVPATF